MYRKGADLERYLVRKYRARGYVAWRTPQSRSPVDLIIYDPRTKKWMLVQVKKIGKGKYYEARFKKDIEQLSEFARIFENDRNVEVWLWVWVLPERRWIKKQIK